MQARPAIVDDIPAFLDTLVAVAAEGNIAAEPPVDVDARARAVTELIEGDGPEGMWVVEREGAPVGFLGLHATGDPQALSLGMLVRADARSAGAGRALLEAAAEHARAAGIRRLELQVFSDNSRAIAFYVRNGFEVVGPAPAPYPRRDGSLREALVMVRPLAVEG